MKQAQKPSHFFTKTQLIILFSSVVIAVLTMLIVSWLLQTSQNSLQPSDLPLIGFNIVIAWLAMYGAYALLIVGLGLLAFSKKYPNLKRWVLITLVLSVLAVVLRIARG